MNRRIAFAFFFIFLLAAVFLHYRDFLQPGQSLYLANFDDPAPRFSFYPWLVESSRQIQHGHFPLWCNLEGAGFPLLADYQSSPLNPFNLAFELFPRLRLLDYLLLLKIILLGVFTYLFASSLGLSPLPAAASAVIICFSGYVSRTVNQVNLNTELWLPAGLLVIEKIIQGRARLFKMTLLGIVTSLALLGGNPEAAFYFLLIITLYGWFRAGFAQSKYLLIILPGIGLGFLLSSAQLLSFLEYLGFGWHIHNQYLHTIGKAPIRWAFSLFFPWLFGPNRAHPEQLFTLGYLGLIPVLLAIFSLVRIRILRQPALFFWALALVLLAEIYRLPPASYLSQLPIFNRVASVKFAYFGVCFAIAILSGFGLEIFQKEKLNSRRFGISLGIVAILAIGSIICAFKFPFSSTPLFILRAAWLFPMLLLLVAAVICLYGIFFQETKLASALIVFLCLINLLQLYPGLRPETKIAPAQWQFRNPSLPNFLRPLVGDWDTRFTALQGIFHQNLNLIFRLNDFRVFEGIYPKSYVRAVSEIEGFDPQDAVPQFFLHGWSFDITAQNISHPLVNQLGIKYLISAQPIQITGWEVIAQPDNYYILQNRNAWPRTWIKDPNNKIVFRKSSLSQNLPDLVKVGVTAKEPAEMILSDQYAPGWRAFRLPAGEEIKINLENPLFRKVPIQPDDKFILFIYHPYGFRIGLFLSIVSCCSLALAFLISFFPKNRS